jgi:hypothetical protein
MQAVRGGQSTATPRALDRGHDSVVVDLRVIVMVEVAC